MTRVLALARWCLLTVVLLGATLGAVQSAQAGLGPFGCGMQGADLHGPGAPHAHIAVHDGHPIPAIADTGQIPAEGAMADHSACPPPASVTLSEAVALETGGVLLASYYACPTVALVPPGSAANLYRPPNV